MLTNPGLRAHARRCKDRLFSVATAPIGASQGVAQNSRRTDQGEKVRSFIDASKLREALGYR
jgi:hypothetical protein